MVEHAVVNDDAVVVHFLGYLNHDVVQIPTYDTCHPLRGSAYSCRLQGGSPKMCLVSCQVKCSEEPCVVPLSVLTDCSDSWRPILEVVSLQLPAAQSCGSCLALCQ